MRILFGALIGFGSLLLALGLADSDRDILPIFLGFSLFGGGILGGLELIINTLEGEKQPER